MAAANPNTARITNPMWRMWTDGQQIIPGVRLGGIYANKKCYHNTRAANQANWPTAYCIKVPLDLKGPDDKAAAIDYTMSDAEMRKRTGYLKRSAQDPRDNRLAAVKEFFGTLDGKTVFGMAKDDDDGPWRFTSSDTSHLWHIHMSILRAFVAMWSMLEPILSVLSGETWEQWQARKSGGENTMFCIYGEESDKVLALQLQLLDVDPNSLPKFGPDRGYGDEVATAVSRLLTGGDGKTYGPKEYAILQRLVAQKFAGRDGKDGKPGQPGPDGKTPTKVQVLLDAKVVEVAEAPAG